MQVVRQSQQKRNKNTKQEEFLHFFGISIVGTGSLLIKKVNKSTYCYYLQLNKSALNGRTNKQKFNPGERGAKPLCCSSLS